MQRSLLRRRGITLIELLIASTIMTLLVGTLGVMASAVFRSNEYCHSYGLAAQHARVALDRISRTVNDAVGNESHPGVIVLEETVASFTFPETLVVWNPTGEPVNRDAGPRVNELVIFAPNPSAPNELLEITDPTNTSTLPAYADTAAWKTAIDALRSSNTAKRVLLTDLLRVSRVSQAAASNSAARRGCVRFVMRVRPSLSDWATYSAAADESAAWAALPWAQSIHGTKTGTRQTWLRFELQLMPGTVAANPADSLTAAPFFGSAALYYQLRRR